MFHDRQKTNGKQGTFHSAFIDLFQKSTVNTVFIVMTMPKKSLFYTPQNTLALHAFSILHMGYPRGAPTGGRSFGVL